MIAQLYQIFKSLPADARSFLVSAAASITWDAVKKLFSGKKDDVFQALANTMEQFYAWAGFEYNEELVVTSFLESANKYRGRKLEWYLREVVEDAVGQILTDDAFKHWLEILNSEYRRDPIRDDHVFADRETTLRRVLHKLADEPGITYGQFGDIIDQAQSRFNSSWKYELLEMIEDLIDTDDFDVSTAVAFIKSNEDPDAIWETFDKLLSGVEINKEVKEMMENPRYNKVWMLTGSSGSGKTHLVQLFSVDAAELLKLRLRGIKEVKVCVPCPVKVEGDLWTSIIRSLQTFFGYEETRLEYYSELTEAIGIRVCLVLENINTILNDTDDWGKVETVLRTVCKFDSLNLIITFNEYEYYLIEPAKGFLERFCHETEDTVFHNCFSLDEENEKQGIVKDILDEHNISFWEEEFRTGITTPKEAIIYAECAGNDEGAPPATYKGFITDIVRWKDAELNNRVHIKNVVDIVSKNRTCEIDGESIEPSELKILEDVQLLSFNKPTERSIFSEDYGTDFYQLRINPFWAAKLIKQQMSPATLLLYPPELKEWLVCCYIFYNDENNLWSRGREDFFQRLKTNDLLSYALFCAHKASKDFWEPLADFIETADIDDPKVCYAVLRFIDKCPLSVEKKFSICVIIAKAVVQYQLEDIYQRTIEKITDTLENDKSIRRNMRSLAKCEVGDINHINGYCVGRKYMRVVEKDERLVWNVVQFLRQNPELVERIKDGNNRSFMDFFLRKCFEDLIAHKQDKSLKEFYEENANLMNSDDLIGPYVKRNLTCAAGNLFQDKRFSSYREEYIDAVRDFSEDFNLYNRLTAWFLIINSIDSEEEKLDLELLEILERLVEDSEVYAIVGDQMERLLQNNL